MSKFILKLITFLFCAGLAVSSLFLIPKHQDENIYIAGMIGKHNRLDSINTPKIILAAGSNMAFGIDSEKIERTFSLPVINLSIHAGLGASFILEELKSSISSGDVVFLSLEYFLGAGDDRLKKNASNLYVPASDYYSMDIYSNTEYLLDDTRENVKNVFRNIINPPTSSIDKVYTKQAFNKYGDVVSHLNKKNKPSLKGKREMEYVYWEKIEEINDFYDFAVKLGVSVFYLYPTYPISQYELNEKVIKSIQNDLNNDLRIEIINEPSSFVYHDSLFFDTVYHLNKSGRQKRTASFIELLNVNLNVQKALKIRSLLR